MLCYVIYGLMDTGKVESYLLFIGFSIFIILYGIIGLEISFLGSFNLQIINKCTLAFLRKVPNLMAFMAFHFIFAITLWAISSNMSFLMAAITLRPPRLITIPGNMAKSTTLITLRPTSPVCHKSSVTTWTIPRDMANTTTVVAFILIVSSI